MKLESIEAQFTQEPDSCDDSSLAQTLTVTIDDAGAGPYIIISTPRWAIDKNEMGAFVERLMRLLERVEKGSE